MNTLLEIEKIKQLKARYFRALDTNDWDVFAATLSENCEGSYSDGDLCFDGREAIVSFMRENLSGENILTLHNGHHPEIEIINESSATGVWYLEDIVLALESSTRIYGGGIYADEYQKVDDRWLISKTGYKRTFECAEPLDEKHVVIKNMFASA